MVFPRRLIFCLFATPLVSCGPPVTNKTLEKDLRDRQELLETYTPLVGFYKGLVKNDETSSEPFWAQLEIYITEEPNGISEDSEIKFRPGLRAHYKRLDLAAEGIGDRNLIVRFYKETTEIAASTSSSQIASGSRPDAGYLSFAGTWKQNEIQGEFRDHRGRLGSVNFERQPQDKPGSN